MNSLINEFVLSEISKRPKAHLMIVKGMECISPNDELKTHQLFDNFVSINRPSAKESIDLINSKLKMQQTVFLTYIEFAYLHSVNLLGLFRAYEYKTCILDFNFFDTIYVSPVNSNTNIIDESFAEETDTFYQDVFARFEVENNICIYAYNQINYGINEIIQWLKGERKK